MLGERLKGLLVKFKSDTVVGKNVRCVYGN